MNRARSTDSRKVGTSTNSASRPGRTTTSAAHGRTDIGGASYWFHYDNARQLTAQGNSRRQNHALAFDAAGQMVQIQDNAVGQTIYYAYNAAGQHVLDQTIQRRPCQNQTLRYDTLTGSRRSAR